MKGRSFGALDAVLDSLAGSGLPFYTLADYEAADFARADRALAALEARSDVPEYLAQLLASWRAALKDLAPFENGSGWTSTAWPVPVTCTEAK